MTRMFAHVTEQGTAMPETGICGQCRGDDPELHDVTGNSEIRCQVCGHPKAPSIYESAAYLAYKDAVNGWTAELLKHIAARTRDTYPTAVALRVEVTYNEDGDTGVALKGVLDANGESLADNDLLTTPEFDSLSDDLWEPLNNLNDLDLIVDSGDEGELEFNTEEG